MSAAREMVGKPRAKVIQTHESNCKPVLFPPLFSSMIDRRGYLDVVLQVLKSGIPPSVRSKVWPLLVGMFEIRDPERFRRQPRYSYSLFELIGNSLMITEELYGIFGRRAAQAREKFDTKSQEHAADVFGKETTFTYIDVDLTRTFPKLAFFQDDGSNKLQLRDLLDTYCFYRPDVGYVQGMSYLAGIFLLYMPPFQAFVCFSNLLHSPYSHAFLKLDHEKMNARYQVHQVRSSYYFQGCRPKQVASGICLHSLTDVVERVSPGPFKTPNDGRYYPWTVFDGLVIMKVRKYRDDIVMSVESAKLTRHPNRLENLDLIS